METQLSAGSRSTGERPDTSRAATGGTPPDRRRTTTSAQPGSSSLDQPEYWWYRARAELLEVMFSRYLGAPALTLDVGSADGPSVGWMRGDHTHVSLDLIPEGLTAGEGVCGSVVALPFADAAFDVVSAFDVVEHCADDTMAMAELTRVLAPGGRLLLAVPAYRWAWSDHDVRAGHHRRYTRRRFVALVEEAGLEVLRSTYAFSGVFPFFVAERVARRLKRSSDSGAEASRLPRVPSLVERVLLGLCRVDRRVLATRDLPFGSSVFVAALKPRA